MMRSTCAIMFVILLAVSSAFAATGTVNLGVVFNYHPEVLLYYYPSYNSFMHPIKGKLTKANILAAEKAIAVKRERNRKNVDEKLAKADKALERIEAEKKKIERQIAKVKNLHYEKQRKRASGASPEKIRKLNLEFRQELVRALTPHEEKLKSVTEKENSIKAEKEELKKKEFYFEFTNPAETKLRLKKIKDEIRKAVRTVAQKEGLDLVINSLTYEIDARESEKIERAFAVGNYNRIRIMAGILEKERVGKDDLDTFTNMYINKIKMSGDLPVDFPYVRELIASQNADITIKVIAEILKESQINSKVKSAIVSFLKDNYKT